MRQLLRQKIDILRPTYSQSGNMGISNTTTAVYSQIGASIQPATSSILFYYAQRQVKVTHTIFVAGTVALERGDTIEDQDGNTYQIIAPRDLSGRGKVTAIDCELHLP